MVEIGKARKGFSAGAATFVTKQYILIVEFVLNGVRFLNARSYWISPLLPKLGDEDFALIYNQER